ncbi:MAG TPA: ABC transporter substrate-binding protein [Stellaceae bacterium]|jgi:NitT/TauT family transport system substrate-binding protein|nr:ABC transporter substrate-binding protein [Stellaceae bacterium]
MKAKAIIGAVFVAAMIASAANAEPVRIRIGWAQVPTQMTPLVAELAKTHPALFPNLNKTYTYEPMRFQGSPPQIQAFAASEIEVAAYGPSALALSVTNAHLDPRVIADIAQDGSSHGFYSTWWAVRKDGPIKTLADLKGHTVIVNAKGATTDMLLRKMTRNSGVADTDFTEIEADFTNMLPMLEAGKGDAAPVMAQFSHDFEATGHYRTLFTTTDAVGGDDETLFWVMKADFIKANRPAIVDMLTDHMAAIRWFLDPANRNDALAITHDFTKQSLQSLDYAFTKDDVYRSPDLMPVIPPIQKDIDIAVSMKMLPASIDVSKYVDVSMVAEAAKRFPPK